MNTNQSLEQLHRQIIIRLAAALGNLRMLAIGAPFATELIRLAVDEVEVALEAAREAESVRRDLRRAVGSAGPTFSRTA